MNIYDIAKKANVSVATVSRVMNGTGSVRESTRQRVEKAIEEMNFTPSSIARSLSNQQTDNIGIVVSDIANPFYTRALSGITKAAGETSYNTFLFSTGETMEKQLQILKAIKGENLKGIILNPVFEEDEQTVRVIQELELQGVAVVLLDRDIYGRNFNGVFSDDFGGSYKAVEHLIRIGHRRIGIFQGPLLSRPGRERFQGYLRALQDNGIPLDMNLVKEYSFLLDGTVYDGTRELMNQEDPPTAIFTSNNFGTLECMKSLLDMKYKIGKDVGLISFDDIDILNYTGIQLSVIDRPVERMGEEAMKLLKMCIDEKSGNAVKQKIVIDTHLVLRGSEKCDRIKTS